MLCYCQSIIGPNNKQLPLGLISQLADECTGIREFRVRIPVQAFLATAKVRLINCEDHIHSYMT